MNDFKSGILLSVWDIAKQIEEKYYDIEILKSTLILKASNKGEGEKIIEISQNNAKLRYNREHADWDR